MTAPKRPRLGAALVLLSVLLVGAIAGAATATLVITRRLSQLFEGSPKQTMARLYGFELGRQLHLSSDQRSAIESIVAEDHVELARLGREHEPQLSVLRHRRHARIRELLTPAQQSKFDQLSAQFEQRRRQEIDLDP
jgi:hypothetical protein